MECSLYENSFFGSNFESQTLGYKKGKTKRKRENSSRTLKVTVSMDLKSCLLEICCESLENSLKISRYF